MSREEHVCQFFDSFIITLRDKDWRIWFTRLNSLKSIVSLLALDSEAAVSFSGSTASQIKRVKTINIKVSDLNEICTNQSVTKKNNLTYGNRICCTNTRRKHFCILIMHEMQKTLSILNSSPRIFFLDWIPRAIRLTPGCIHNKPIRANPMTLGLD